MKVFYIEMVCNDEELIAENVKVIILYNLAILSTLIYITYRQ